jgi:hypothetical protein
MDKDHRDALKDPGFNPADYSAKIYFTTAYDMLNRTDRSHLIYIMTTLAELGGASM